MGLGAGTIAAMFTPDAKYGPKMSDRKTKA